LQEAVSDVCRSHGSDLAYEIGSVRNGDGYGV